jgi:hypothetical protein
MQNSHDYNVIHGEIDELLQGKPVLESLMGYYEAVEPTETPCRVFNRRYSGKFSLA